MKSNAMRMHERMAVEFVNLTMMGKPRVQIQAELLSTFHEATAEDWHQALGLFQQFVKEFERVGRAASVVIPFRQRSDDPTQRNKKRVKTLKD